MVGDDDISRAIEAWLIAGLGKGAHQRRELTGGNAVLTVANAPTGAVGFATLGLYRTTYPRSPEVGRNRFELIGAARREDLTTYLATAARIVARARQAPLEGAVIEGLAERAMMPSLAATFPHAVFLPPGFWDELDVLELPDFRLVPVLALPISSAERKFLRARGTNAFIDLVRRSKIDAFDLSRDPMIVEREHTH